MRRFLLLLLVLVVGASCAPQKLDVTRSANLEERRMGSFSPLSPTRVVVVMKPVGPSLRILRGFRPSGVFSTNSYSRKHSESSVRIMYAWKSLPIPAASENMR